MPFVFPCTLTLSGSTGSASLPSVWLQVPVWCQGQVTQVSPCGCWAGLSPSPHWGHCQLQGLLHPTGTCWAQSRCGDVLGGGQCHQGFSAPRPLPTPYRSFHFCLTAVQTVSITCPWLCSCCSMWWVVVLGFLQSIMSLKDRISQRGWAVPSHTLCHTPSLRLVSLSRHW